MEAEMGLRPTLPESPIRDFTSESEQLPSADRHGLWDRLHLNRLHHFFGKDETRKSGTPCPDAQPCTKAQQGEPRRETSSRSVGVGLPRQATFRRQNSEKRDRLLAYEPCPAERRAMSASRQTSLSLGPGRSRSSPPPTNVVRSSAPALTQSEQFNHELERPSAFFRFDEEISPINLEPEPMLDDTRLPRPPSRTSSDDSRDQRFPELDERAQLNAELDSKWILNLSMHFRDKSDREKFFVTYAEKPNRWRRVTVSCDYRNAEPGSLEMDLKELRFQRDKSLQIYEAIRDSLPSIQFYETVTNLKLETSDGRLHVHVTEDTNEIIPYPPKTTVAHILEDAVFKPMEIREADLVFDSHLSGFVYKVAYQGKTYIKKEIPGPDTVDEFLYEINALHALNGSQYVIQLEAIIVDDLGQNVKGLLISFAERGAVVDLLYDHKGEIPWEDRLRWAKQAVRGLSEIHEEGYVQGDFTLSNIVVDENNNAQIIDINRRGCPVGWEPPEIAKKIASNQRISMYIGEKSDLYQLGMTLWALAMDDDEPERHDPPLSTEEFPSEIPEWYQDIVRNCLEPQPRDRLSAKELLGLFGTPSSTAIRTFDEPRPYFVTRDSKEFIDPAAAVERDDLERFSRQPVRDEDLANTPGSSFDDWTYTFPRSSNYEYESTSSQLERPRGRGPATNTAHLDRYNYNRSSGEAISPLDDEEDLEPQVVSIAPGREPEYEEFEIYGQHCLVPRARGEATGLGISDGRPSEEANQQLQEDDTTPRAAREPSNNTEALQDDIELESPIDVAQNDASATSDSTPRNAQSMLANSETTGPSTSALTLNMSSTDLAGFGSHPDLDQHSPHEPKFMAIPEASNDPLDVEEVVMTKAPPGMPFADSGYEEPVHFEFSDGDVHGDEPHGEDLPAIAEEPLPIANHAAEQNAFLFEELPPLPPSPVHFDFHDGDVYGDETHSEDLPAIAEEPLPIANHAIEQNAFLFEELPPLPPSLVHFDFHDGDLYGDETHSEDLPAIAEEPLPIAKHAIEQNAFLFEELPPLPPSPKIGEGIGLAITTDEPEYQYLTAS